VKDEKERFFRVYPNVPLQERNLTCVVIDDEPISWHLARLYIEGNTELGDRILTKLSELDII
jgi:hypothetical protein